MSKLINDLALVAPCPYCRAEAHDWCVTTTGRRSTFLHAFRTEPVREAYGEGYHSGYQEALSYAIDQPEHWARFVAREQRRREQEVA